jgi:chemotaxis protein CheD
MPKTTLAERMQQAQQRTREARLARQGGAMTLPAPLQTTPEEPAPAAGRIQGLGPRSRVQGWVEGIADEQLALMPGEMHFGAQVASLRTLLGSCVAVTLWHPARRIGGMCHYLLPTRPQRTAVDAPDGRYGDEALDALVTQLRRAGTEPAEYQAHLYGGADTMPEGSPLRFNVGERNIEQGWSLLDRWGFQLQGVDVGEDVPRSVSLTLATGEVEMRRGNGRAPPLQLGGHLQPTAPNPVNLRGRTT